MEARMPDNDQSRSPESGTTTDHAVGRRHRISQIGCDARSGQGYRPALTSLAVAALLLPGLSGCGQATTPAGPSSTAVASAGAGDSNSTGSASPSDSSGASGSSSGAGRANLTITVTNANVAGGQRWTLTCDPDGGTHPDPAKACAVLSAHGETLLLKPLPKNMMCTEIYGGAQTATIQGVWRGRTVRASFSRTNGCEIARWTALTGLLPQADLSTGTLS
jgi:hypothetical protein